MAGVDWDNISSAYAPSVNLVNGRDKLIDHMSKTTALVDSVFKDKRSLDDKNYAHLQDSNATKLLTGLSSGELKIADLNAMNLSNVNGQMLQKGIDSILTRDEQHRVNTSNIARNAALVNESKMNTRKDEMDIATVNSEDMGAQLSATVENAYSSLTDEQLKALQVGGEGIYKTLEGITGISTDTIKKTLKGKELNVLRKGFNELIERKIADPITKGTILKERALAGDAPALNEVSASDQQYVTGESQFIKSFFLKASAKNKGKMDAVGQYLSAGMQAITANTTDSEQETQIKEAKYAIAQATEAIAEESLTPQEAVDLKKNIIRAQDFIYVAEMMTKGEMGGSIDIIARNESRKLKESLNQYNATKEVGKLAKKRQAMKTTAALDASKKKKKTPAKVAEEVTDSTPKADVNASKADVNASDAPDPIQELVDALIPSSKKTPVSKKKKVEAKSAITTVIEDYEENSNLKIPKGKMKDVTSVAKELLKKNSDMTPSRAVRRALHKLGLNKK